MRWSDLRCSGIGRRPLPTGYCNCAGRSTSICAALPGRRSSVISVCIGRPVAWRDGLLRCGLPGGTRTPDLLLRRQLLYPVELRAVRAGRGRVACGRGGGIRTRDLSVPNRLRYQAALRPERRDCTQRGAREACIGPECKAWLIARVRRRNRRRHQAVTWVHAFSSRFALTGCGVRSSCANRLTRNSSISQRNSSSRSSRAPLRSARWRR